MSELGMTDLGSDGPLERDDGRQTINPLTAAGAEVFGQLERALQEGGAPVGLGDLHLLGAAVEAITDYQKLVNTAAAGDPDALTALRIRLLGDPGAQFWHDLDALSGRWPTGPRVDAPCLVAPIDPLPIMWAGFHLGGDLGESGWVERAFGEHVALAGPVETVLAGAGEWLGEGDAGPLLAGFADLRSIGLPGRTFTIPCLDEQQVCLGELLNFTRSTIVTQIRFPPMGALTPTDACFGYSGPITIFPASGTFPAPGSLPGVVPTIDRVPAEVITWTASQIQLRLPAGITPGCHTVGWMYMTDPADVTQLRAIGEQCMPWFPSNVLRPFAYSIWRDDASFSLVGDPAIRFNAPGGGSLHRAEACSAVLLSWAATLDVCASSKATRFVSLWRDGQLFRATLPVSGQLPVRDADDATYTLRAASRLGAQTCGTAQSDVTITREHWLRMHYPIERCLDTGSTLGLDVTISCPAPPGGVPVTVTSDRPARIANAAATIPEGATSAVVDMTAGTECGPVWLTASAPAHTSPRVQLVVVAAPQVTALTPATVLSCEPVSLTVTGRCMGDPSVVAPIVTLLGIGGEVRGAVTVRVPDSELAVSFPAQPPGPYTVVISNCGRIGYAPIPLTVQLRPPLITAPLKSSPSAAAACVTPSLTLSWEVRYASRVSLARGGIVIAERSYSDLCAPTADSVTDQLPRVTGAITYTLTAFNPDGSAATSMLTVPPISGGLTGSRFAVTNGASVPVNVFMLNAEDLGGTLVREKLPAGEKLVVTIPTCSVRAMHSIIPSQVTGGLDPKAVATARTTGLWSRNSSASYLGLPSAGTVPFSA